MAPRDHPPKTTLYCPECPHESRATGDWRLVGTGREVRLVCPNCRTTVATRPAAGSVGRGASR